MIPKGEALLEDWTYDGIYLHGIVTGHSSPKCPDGGFIHTTKVIRIDFDRGVAETKNTFYKLGTPKDQLPHDIH